MLARLGSHAFERYEHERGAGGLTVRRHIGWRWPCDCSTFARPEGDYLWVACRKHDVVPRGGLARRGSAMSGQWDPLLRR